MNRDFYWKRIVLVAVIWLIALHELEHQDIPPKKDSVEQIKATAKPTKECF